MNALFESVKEVIRKETAEMKSGVVKANPKNTGGAVRCRYCPYKPVCRIENTTEKPY